MHCQDVTMRSRSWSAETRITKSPTL